MKKFILMLYLLIITGLFQGVYSVEDIVSLDDIPQTSSQEVKISVPESAEPMKAEIKFDWLDITQAQRDDSINYYKNLLFDNNTSRVYFDRNSFKSNFAQYFKDKEYKHHYFLTNNGVTEDEDAKYCAFYYKKGTLVMYAIQYKNNPTKAFYYTAFGKLYYTDVMSDEYPNFPYTSMQYNRKGQLKSAIYFISKDLQYMFDSNKEFQGIWYKDKMYDRSGKQTLTRTNW